MFARTGSSNFRRMFRDREAGAVGPLDAARRARYTALLRRWILERIPSGTTAAPTAADWITDAIAKHGTSGASERGRSLLVALRTQLFDDRSHELRSRPAGCAMPSSRVEQIAGCDHVDAWEIALAMLPRRQRELAILRVEFGLDDDAIAAELSTPVASARAETVNALAALIDALGCGLRDRAA